MFPSSRRWFLCERSSLRQKSSQKYFCAVKRRKKCYNRQTDLCRKGISRNMRALYGKNLSRVVRSSVLDYGGVIRRVPRLNRFRRQPFRKRRCDSRAFSKAKANECNIFMVRNARCSAKGEEFSNYFLSASVFARCTEINMKGSSLWSLEINLLSFVCLRIREIQIE